MKSESIEQLKQNMVETFRKYGNEIALRTKGKTFTGNEIANEIENETEFGIESLNSAIRLTIDLLKRDKVNLYEPTCIGSQDSKKELESPLMETFKNLIIEIYKKYDDEKVLATKHKSNTGNEFIMERFDNAMQLTIDLLKGNQNNKPKQDSKVTNESTIGNTCIVIPIDIKLEDMRMGCKMITDGIDDLTPILSREETDQFKQLAFKFMYNLQKHKNEVIEGMIKELDSLKNK